MYEVDLDTETVLYEGAWLTRDDLVRKVRSMMDSGDYLVARPGQALEHLTRALSNARVLPVRMAPELADALSTVANREGRSVGSIIREALSAFVGIRPVAPPPVEGAQAAMPAPGQGSTGVETVPASPEEATSAVTLTPKKREGERIDDEKRWFGR